MGRRVVKPEALQSVFVGVRFILSGMYLQSRTRPGKAAPPSPADPAAGPGPHRGLRTTAGASAAAKSAPKAGPLYLSSVGFV